MKPINNQFDEFAMQSFNQVASVRRLNLNFLLKTHFSSNAITEKGDKKPSDLKNIIISNKNNKQ